MTRRLYLIAGSLIILSTFLIPTSSNAYITSKKWDVMPQPYGIDPNLDASLGISGGGAIVRNAASQWNDASGAYFFEAGYNPNTSGMVTTADFRGQGECLPSLSEDIPDGTVGIVCTDPPYYSTTRLLTYTKMVLNKSPSIIWNTSGVMNFNTWPNPNQVDAKTIILHEFGHYITLGDNPSGQDSAVMTTRGLRTKQILQEDDKQGATQTYGPWTGFDGQKASGMQNQLGLSLNITGYNSGIVPELHPVGQGQGVTPWYGDQMEVIAGTANGARSYAYFKLFDVANDTDPIDMRVFIRPGMRLKWCQYNYQQSTFSLDFEMDDGTTFRDSLIRDANYNVYPHPAARASLPQNQWLCFDYDLFALRNKR